MSSQNALTFGKTLTPGAGALGFQKAEDELATTRRNAAAARNAPILAQIEASKITQTDIANQRRARAIEANQRGAATQTIGRGAATLFAPNAGTSATKTLLGQ